MESQIKELFYKSKKHSRKWEKYFDVYEELFKKYKNKDIKFVEIGIQNGGSLEIWKNYFSKNSEIIGIDLNPECKKFEKDNVKVFIGNQSDSFFWKNFFNKVGKVDIILDDGGHTNLDQIITSVNVIDKINDDGMLVVEDTITSYVQEYNSNPNFSFINFSKKTVDDINFKNNENMKQFNFSLNNFVNSIEFFESFVIFKINRKKCLFNKPLNNDGENSQIKDLTWSGNDLNEKKIKNFFQKIPFIKFRKITKILKNKINDKIIKKYFY